MPALRLEEAANIGPSLAQALRQVGIQDLESLIAVGPAESWERLRSAGLFDCVNSLLALHGAVRGVRWQQLPEPVKRAAAAQLDAGQGRAE